MLSEQIWTPSPNELDYFLANVKGKKDALASMGFPVFKDKENMLSVHIVAQTQHH